MIFNLTLDFTNIARLVAGGHMINTPTDLTYTSVVSMDSIRICFLIATLDVLDIMTDVCNEYLNAINKERCYAIAGKEFGKDEGKTVMIVRDLHWLKGSGAA